MSTQDSDKLRFAQFICIAKDTGALVINDEFTESTDLSEDDVDEIIDRARFASKSQTVAISSDNTNPVWDDDLVQFARLIDEACASGSFTINNAFSDKINMSVKEINYLCDDAMAVFQKSKDALFAK